MCDDAGETRAQFHQLQPNHDKIYRAIRLRALSESPTAFSSTFAGECAFPAERWLERLRNPVARTYIATRNSDIDILQYDLTVFETATTPEIFENVDKLFFGLITCVQSNEDPMDACLASMWVAPSARGRGVGKALVQCAIEWARGCGLAFRRILLGVRTQNASAIALYTSCGFVSVDRPNQVASEVMGEEGKRMELRLVGMTTELAK